METIETLLNQDHDYNMLVSKVQLNVRTFVNEPSYDNLVIITESWHKLYQDFVKKGDKRCYEFILDQLETIAMIGKLYLPKSDIERMAKHSFVSMDKREQLMLIMDTAMTGDLETGNRLMNWYKEANPEAIMDSISLNS